MSWLDKIKTALVIETGDGKQYKPQWLNASKSVDYNVAEFDFPNVSGTLVKRGTPRGAKYSLELYFQGTEHLDEAARFEVSASDPRPWNITHPFYGRVTVQPTSLSFDNSGYNISKVTGTVIETITDSYPKGTVNPIDKIAQDTTATNATMAKSYSNNVVMTASDINRQQSAVAIAFNNAKKFVPQDAGEQLFNEYNESIALLADAQDDTEGAMAAMQKVIVSPATYAISVKNRVTVLGSSFNSFRDALDTTTTKNQKQSYAINNGTSLSALALAASTPQATDYTNRSEVVTTVEQLIDYYNQYLEDLDTLQTDNGGAPDSFIPDADSLRQLNLLYNYTLSNLFNIALNAKQERSLVLLEDSNWILLAHKFYGMDANDENISTLMQQNNAGLSTALQVEKNTRVYYYV
jgi:hypothetical protein